jgi:hypothetical protein
MADNHVEVQASPPLALPNDGEMQAPPEYTILGFTILLTVVKAAPSTVSASARLFNALARLTHEIRHLIRAVRASTRKPKTPNKR